MTDQILIFDTTLRDGEQSPGCSMNIEEKLRVAAQLEALGVDIIEAGFAIASEGDFEAVQAVARQCERAVVASLARASRTDIDRAWAALRDAKRPRIGSPRVAVKACIAANIGRSAASISPPPG